MSVLRKQREFKEKHQTERSEEHTSELQSPCNLVCRLLLEKKKTKTDLHFHLEHRHYHQPFVPITPASLDTPAIPHPSTLAFPYTSQSRICSPHAAAKMLP